MKTSSWTKSEVAEAFAACTTLKEVISTLEVNATANGEVICEVCVNGLVLSEEDESAFAADSVDAIETLSIQTQKPFDLMRDALKSAAELLPQLETSALSTAELLRAGDVARSAHGFEETISGCQWLVETLMHVRGASLGLGQTMVQPQAWSTSEQLIGRVVNDVSAAYERSDSILVADLLEYEMTAALASWKATIATELD